MFAGIEGIARKASGAYIGVDGVARRAKKLYMGVNGKARLCWEAGSGSGGGESSGVRAYLYNGVKLPELPKWDKETYPYAYIMYATTGVYYLAFSAEERTSTASDSIMLYSGDLKYKYTDGAWVETTVSLTRGDAVWSNYDVHYGEAHELAGEIYCEASNPVPLYSYNGVELPELPEWDNTKFPKCTIDYFPVLRKYYFRAFAPDAYYFYSNGKLYFGSNYSSGVLVQSSIASIVGNYGAWSELKENDIGNTSVTETFWANFDMEYEGTLYMAASEPQPVYL